MCKIKDVLLIALGAAIDVSSRFTAKAGNSKTAQGQPDKEIFDLLRELEEMNYQRLKRLLGSSFELVHELLSLYAIFIKSCLKVVTQLDANQAVSLLHCLHWMKNEATAGTVTLMRGHVADSGYYTRKTLEIGAFIARMYKDKDAARMWIEAGSSDQARTDYVKAFPAFSLVKKTLPPALVAEYENDCLAVHPSFLAIAKRAFITDDLKHRFVPFDLDERDPYQVYFVMEFLNLCSCHSQIMEFLSTLFSQSPDFDSEAWAVAYGSFVYKFQVCRQLWTPRIDAHFTQAASAAGPAQ